MGAQPLFQPGAVVTCHGETALTQDHFVSVSGPRVAGLIQVSTSGAGARVFGVAAETTLIATACAVNRGGILKVVAGEAISAGDLLASNAAGEAIVAVGDAVVVAEAYDDAAEDELVILSLLGGAGGDSGAGFSTADAVADLSATDPADSPATADALRDDLVTNTIPSIETKFNALLAELRQAGVIAP